MTISIPPHRAAPAFTLLELMGVLTVMSLLVWLAADGALARGKRANRQAEAAELSLISDAWLQTALRTRTLPATTNWVTWLATGATSLPEQRIARNGAAYARQTLFDPGARWGRPLALAPFAQTSSGSLEPVAPRLILISSLSAELPDLQSLPFDALWTNPPDGLPTGWPSTWTGEPGDLLMERMDLRTRFHRVILHNLEADTAAGYGINSEASSVAAGDRIDAWFMTGSRLELKALDGSIQAGELLAEDGSYVFERRRWRRLPGDGPARTSGIGGLADQFLATPAPPDSGRSAADQSAVVDEVVQFLNAYANWSSHGFPSSGGGGAAANPLHRSLTESQARLLDFTHHLILP